MKKSRSRRVEKHRVPLVSPSFASRWDYTPQWLPLAYGGKDSNSGAASGPHISMSFLVLPAKRRITRIECCVQFGTLPRFSKT